MKRAAILFLFISPLTLSAKDRQWNNGTLLSYDQNTFTTYSQTNGNGQEHAHTTYKVQIDAGDRIYFVERTLNWRWQKFPQVTENGSVTWTLKGDHDMIVRDDKGKEFTVTILKSRLKSSPQSSPNSTE